TSVAPNFLASSSFASLVSIATMRSAPAIAQPWITLSPTPPAPHTPHVDPGTTLAVLMAAPTPVVTPQPTSAARSAGTLESYFTRLRSCTTAYSAITPTPENTLSGLPAASRVRLVPSSMV